VVRCVNIAVVQYPFRMGFAIGCVEPTEYPVCLRGRVKQEEDTTLDTFGSERVDKLDVLLFAGSLSGLVHKEV